jgi:diguanylate cyclase (GGDEF)-like protein/PAS domain S-box-containing protein
MLDRVWQRMADSKHRVVAGKAMSSARLVATLSAGLATAAGYAVRARRYVMAHVRPKGGSTPVRNLVGLLGAVIALVTALTIPIGYGIIGYLKEADALTYKAELTAAEAAQYYYAPKSWGYDSNRLAAMNDIRTATTAPVIQRISDVHGKVVAETGPALAWPTFSRRAPINAAGSLVGNAEVVASLRPLLTEVGFVGLGSLLLAVAAYFAFTVLPLRVIDRTLGELEATNDKFRHQNLLLDAALDNMAQGLVMFDADERVVIANKRFQEMYGLSVGRLAPGMTLRQVAEMRVASGLYKDFDVDAVVDTVRERVARGTPSHLKSRIGDGRIFFVTIFPRPGGGWVSTHQDITERERLNDRLEQQNRLLTEQEEQLRSQNQQLDTALNNMVQGLAMFDADARIVIANERYARLYDLELEQVKPGTTLREIVEHRCAKGQYAGQSIDRIVAAMRKRAGNSSVAHVTNKLSDGRTIVASIQPRADGGWVVTHQDITEREALAAQLARRNELLRQREEELANQNRRFNAAINNMSQGLCLFDAEQRVVFANRRFAELYGLKSRDVKPGTTLRQILRARAAQGVYNNVDADAFVEEAVAGFRQEVSQIVHLADGRFISVGRRPMPDGGLVSTHEDITEREKLYARLADQNDLLRQREEELQAQNERFDAALKNMSHGLCMFDHDQRVLIANARYAEIYGLTPEQVKPGTTLRQIIERRIANGLYAGPDPEAYIKERMARFHETNVAVHHLSDGRAIFIRRQPMRGGGWVTTHEDITEREELQMRLAQQNVQLDAAMNNMSQGLAMFDAEQRLVMCNKLYSELYGLTPEQTRPGTTAHQIVGLRFANGCYPVSDARQSVDDFVARTWSVSSETHELADGRFINISYRKTAEGAHVFTHQDVTERHRLTAEIERNNALLSERTSRLQAIVDNFPGGITFLDSSLRMVVCNEKALRFLDLPGALFADGPPGVEDVLRLDARRGEYGEGEEQALVDERMALVRERRPQVVERERADGTVLELRGVPLDDGGFLTTYMDITERRRSEAKIVHMALHDSLTDLPNRVLLNERLEQALARVKRGEILAVHLLDLDHFKTVNDTMGHPTGDKLLKMVTARLRVLVRDTDTIARMGGDEFAILQVAIVQPADATALALRIIDAVSAPYTIDGQQVVIGTSVGVAIGPLDGLTPDQLIRNSDLALYRAKADGRGTYRFFGPEMDAQLQARQSIEHDLRRALAAGEFELHYQPVVDLGTDEVCGVEALIRWRHPHKGLVPPGTFIPVAEETGFIVPLGEWAIFEACRTAATWPGHIRVAVNLSPRQFRNPGFMQLVVRALEVSGLSAERLELEITENMLMHDTETTLSTLYQLRALGVRIAMDDFGTGYSSLSYLQSFPFDKIKIDRSFVKDIADGVGSLNIVRAVAAMASGLGMATTAEGVETREQLETIRAEGCTEMQGFIFSKPLPAHEIAELLRAHCPPPAVDNANGRAA